MLRITQLSLLVLVLWSCTMTASNNSIFNKESFVDTKINKQGNLELEDTPRMWASFTETVDFRVANEVSGKRPEAGKKTWDEFWLWQIEKNKTGRQNSSRYIKYILNKRRDEGLPELLLEKRKKQEHKK